MILALPAHAKLNLSLEVRGLQADGRHELSTVAAELLQKFEQPVLAEQFLSGREFTVGITGTGPSIRCG